MTCASSCPTRDHDSYGECLRSKNLKTAVSIPGNNWDRGVQSRWDRRLDTYRDARAQGIAPKSSRMSDIQTAVKVSDATGTAFTAQ